MSPKSYPSVATAVSEYWQNRSLFDMICLGLGIIIPVTFVLYTNQVWEDFLITYRHSENLVNGHGLVFSIGEKVHGFTSPFNVLLPALFAWVTQAKDFGLPLLLFRIVSLVGLIAALLTVVSVFSREDPPSQLRKAIGALFPIVAVLEIKTTAFAMNGQETGLMLGFLAPCFALSYLGWHRQSAWLGGICLAGLMYVRPDGFVFALAVGAGGFVFGSVPRPEFCAGFFRSVIIAMVLYAPWMIFAQHYYGSFIPHTIIAKQGTELYQNETFGVFKSFAGMLTKLPQRVTATFSAIYDFQIISGPVTWPKWSHDIAFALELAAVSYWILPTRDRLGRMASLCSLLILSYLTYASLISTTCPWYYPPLAFLSLLSLLRMFITLPAYLRTAFARCGSVIFSVLLVFFLAFIFVNSVRALRIKQQVVDDGNRRPLGLWLRGVVRDDETVFLEPLGYIGYYSQRKIRDWPGLVSPEVVAARREIGRMPNYPWSPFLWGKVAEKIKPDWIVARLTEVEQMRASEELSRDYQLVRVFNVAGQIEDAGVFYGCAVNFDDAVFEVFRRRTSAP